MQARPRNYYTFRHSGWHAQRSVVRAVLLALNQGRTADLPTSSIDLPGDRDGLAAFEPYITPAECPSEAEMPRLHGTVKRYSTRSKAWSEPAINRFSACGNVSWVQRSDDDPVRFRLSTNQCRHRFCVPCQGQRGRLIAANIRAALPDVELRFITLTLSTTREPLHECLDRLYRCFAKLRRGKLWKAHVHGGLAVLELTFNADRCSWHPHLHIIAQGDFLPQAELKDAWHAVTGDSFIVDIRRVRRIDQVASYLTSYLTKSMSPRLWRAPVVLAEAVMAMHGRRMVLTFGRWVKMGLLKAPEDAACWEPYCSMDELLRLGLAGNSKANNILTGLFHGAWLRFQKEKPP